MLFTLCCLNHCVDTMDELLKNFGLTEHEVKIYKALLREGSILAGDITRLTGIHRRNVYDCLERLLQKGFIGYIKQNNRKYYSITDPRMILEAVKQREKKWESLMPELLMQFNMQQEKKETLFFRGIQGIKQVLEDQILVGKEVLVNATTESISYKATFFFPKYHLLRSENKISTRMIFDSDYKEKAKKAKIKDLPLCKHKFVDNFNSSSMSQYIYGDNVAIIVWSEEPIAVLIRQKEVAQGFRDTFELIWNEL